MIAELRSSELQESAQQALKRFNQAFPSFYEQFASSEVQLQNLKLARALYQSQRTRVSIFSDSPQHPNQSLATHSTTATQLTQPLADTQLADTRLVVQFTHRNTAFLLSDIFSILAAYGFSIHYLSLYGQVRSPRLLFVKLIISHPTKALTPADITKLSQYFEHTLSEKISPQQALAAKLRTQQTIKKLETKFYRDRLFHLPTLMIKAEDQPALLYKVLHAVGQEDLLVVHATFRAWRGQAQSKLCLLSPDGSELPTRLGETLAQSIQQRLENFC
jgi:UTP:GlnB (protein PII) uridylyltransferase